MVYSVDNPIFQWMITGGYLDDFSKFPIFIVPPWFVMEYPSKVDHFGVPPWPHDLVNPITVADESAKATGRERAPPNSAALQSSRRFSLCQCASRTTSDRIPFPPLN
jgi:hypothetical protein